ncbi:MAG: putative Zn-dependent protease [Pseudoalteromonas tetraodonis]
MKSNPRTPAPLIAILLLVAFCLVKTNAQERAEPPSPTPTATEKPSPPEPKTEIESPEQFDAKVATIIEELGSDDFRTREEATVKLWKIGDRAEEAVRKLSKSKDIELRTRAARLLGLYKYGIYPDTPPETVELINQFRHGDLNAKTFAIQKLYGLGNVTIVAKLVRSIEDQRIRSRLVDSVVNGLEEKIAELLKDEQYDEIESLLGLGAISAEGLRNLAGFHLNRGTIDTEIEKLLAKEQQEEITNLDYEQLTWHYRAKGELDNAVAAATSSENKDLITSTKIANGDLLALIEASYNPNDRTIQAYGFTAAKQRLNGETEAFEKTIQTIKEYAGENPEEERACLEALLINGRVTEAIEIAEAGGTNRVQLLIDNGEHAKALAELGIDKPNPPYNDWLDQLVKDFTTAEGSTEHNRILSRAYTLVRLLKGWGEDAEAARIYARLGETAREVEPEFMSRFIANASVLDMHEIALEFTRSAFEKEAKDAQPDADLSGLELEQAQQQNRAGQRDAEESLISALYWENAQMAEFWWLRIRETFADETSLQWLDRLALLLNTDPEKKPDVLKALDQLKPDKANPDFADPFAAVSNIALFYLRLDERAEAMKWFKKSLSPDRSDSANAYFQYASLLADDGNWAEAATHFKSASEAAPSNLKCLIRYAVALEHTGKAEEAAAIIKRAKLMSLGRPIEYWRIAEAFTLSGDYTRAREASQLVLDLAFTEEPIALEESLNLADYLSLDEPERAAMYKERNLIECLRGEITLPRIGYAPSVRGSIASLKARAAIDAGKPDEAITMLREMVKNQPSNSSLVEDVYPMLLAAGKKAEANELYEKLNQYGEDALALFPNSAQDLNSNAWLKARCGRDLDTALKRSTLSNELSKNNYAYLDTLAEVHFQKGDRAKAIAKSEEAVKLSGSDFLLNHQLNRFKNTKPLSEQFGAEQP